MPEAKPSATVVLLRDNPNPSGSQECPFEVLLLQRNPALRFHGGSWVFPGGKLEASDAPAALADDLDLDWFYKLNAEQQQAALKTAATRETYEESGVRVEPDSLRLFARWLTPEGLPKRFDTWFYVGTTEQADIQVDGQEIVSHQWLSPQQALAEHSARRLPVPPPTFVTLNHLSEQSCRQSAIQTMSAQLQYFEPRLAKTESGFCSLYKEDVAYQNLDLNLIGTRHRLIVTDTICHYQKS